MTGSALNLSQGSAAGEVEARGRLWTGPAGSF